jgi:lipid-A-disaccharide synthase
MYNNKLRSHPRDSNSAPTRLVFISAAEPSADVHAAGLIQAARALDPAFRFVGIAGPRMVEAGCHGLMDLSRHAAMLLSAVGSAGQGIAALALADRYLRRFPFVAAVFVDSPTLHLPMAAKAKAMNVPVLYYVAPQLWAWGAYRIYKLRHRVDRLAVILPFEEKYFRDQGVEATFVGHPLAEQVRNQRIDPSAVARLRAHGAPVVALLPGSRKHVVESLLPGQLAIASRLTAEVRGVSFVISVANDQVATIVRELVSRTTTPVHVHSGPCGEVIEAADLVLVASGTAALEVAFHERPMIVMYNTSPLFYHALARWMIRTPHLSLPNILAGREIVSEFMPYYRSTESISRAAIQLLKDEDRRTRMVRDLGGIVAPLKVRNASEETGRMLVALTAEHGH